MIRARKPRIGDRVRIERDEDQYPSKGTWPRYRGREATVVTVNRSDREYGVTFGTVRKRPDGSLAGSDSLTWFRAHELTVLEGGSGDGSGGSVTRGSTRRSSVT